MNLKFKSVFVLLFASVVMMLSSGCAITALTGLPPPAHLAVTNNVADTIMRLESSRSDSLNVEVATGQTVRIPICAVPLGNDYIIRAKFYDASGRYLGVNQQSFYIHFDYSNRYNQAWVVSNYMEPTSRSR